MIEIKCPLIVRLWVAVTEGIYMWSALVHISQNMNFKFPEILFLFKIKVVPDQDALKSIIFSRKAQFSEFSWV